ncbi:hypothetical protein NQ315_012619 [Exocentrus adspersus]|uniref:Large ribosomal subunit protein mL46 n=1 Tax=Exocentrus adspersus TaxID=1586481 RepID=A0AAV8VSV7_9CUCU|nr:hypothetical protein NQ315_012619 [Exocentrus adspersus]
MIKNALRILQTPSTSSVHFRNLSKAPSASPSKPEKWDLLTAICVERKPALTPPLTDLEKEYKQYLQEVEYERSLKSDHEMKLEAEKKVLESLKAGETIEDLDVNLKQTAQDFADACVEELAQFKPADRLTEADRRNDLKSLQRKLDKHLVLVVQQRIGKEKHFLLPQGLRQDGESLRQTAERVLKENCGSDIQARIYGNAPCGFYKYKYPKDVRGGGSGGAVGAKVFFYFARYLNGRLPEKDVDYKWLDRKELYKTLPAPYNRSVSEFLFDE